MLPVCSRRDGLVLRNVHDFDSRGSCRNCGTTREPHVDELERWRAALAASGVEFREVERHPVERPRQAQQGLQAHGTARLADDVDDRIREMLRAGVGIRKTARDCGVSRQAVTRRAAELEDERARELEAAERKSKADRTSAYERVARLIRTPKRAARRSGR
jgi:hypothetical protein